MRSKTILAGGASIVALAAIAVSPAHAQVAEDSLTSPAAAAAAQDHFDDPAIVVTGTRISRPEEDVAHPITILSADYIARSGETNLTDLLAETPALVGSIKTIDTAGPQADQQGLVGGVGANFLNLRNLGIQRTLVLVNGRRHVASLPGLASVDINTIPMGLVERVDVLTGGVSAIYGADAVSGVVNFVLKRDFEGIEGRGQSGISTHGDAGEYYASLTAGRNFDGGAGNVAISYEYHRTERVAAESRRAGRPGGYSLLKQNLADFPVDDPNVPDRVLYDDLRIATFSPLGSVDVNFDGFPEFTGTGHPYNVGMFLPNSQGLAQGGDGTSLAGLQGDFQPQSETHNLNLLASHEFSPALRVYAEGKFVSSKSFTEALPLVDGGTILLADNPYLPDSVRSAIVPGLLGALFGAPPEAGISGALVFRPQFDFGRATLASDRQTWRGVIGADGEIGAHARYDVSYVYGQTKNRFVFGNMRIADRYYAALNAVAGPDGSIACRADVVPPQFLFDPNSPAPPVTFTPGAGSGCAPLNILGSNVASQAALDFFQVDLVNHAKLTQHVLTASITGDTGGFLELPGGPVGFAVGGEYRKETSSLVPDDLLQNGLILDAGAVSPADGSFDVWEGFAEVSAPLLRDVPGVYLLEVGAALRLSDYSTIGSTTTWKVDGTYAPVPDVRLRGTYSRAVRAPNITELFAPPSATRTGLVDPCDTVNLANGTEYRSQNCAALLSGLGVDPATFNPSSNPTSARPIPGVESGNAGLSEEKANTWTAGVQVTPSRLPGFSASLDWYDITLKGAINTPTAQEVVNLCVDQPGLDNVFCPNVSRDPATGFISGFVVAPANVSRFKVSGADFNINYAFEPQADLGAFNLRLVAGYLDKLSFVASPGAPAIEQAKEFGHPEWVGNFDLTWTKGAVTANYGISYASKTRRFTAAELAANPDIADAAYLDYPARWVHDLQLAVTADDERVTFYTGVNNLFGRHPAFDKLNYPVSFRGRFVYFGIRAKLGK